MHAVDRGQQDRQIRAHHGGDKRCQNIVVAETNLIDADRIVLVHDRQNPIGQQRVKAGRHVKVTLAILHVRGRQQ